MEGNNTESSINSFLAGRLRKSVMLDEIFASYLPQFIAGKEKVRFKLRNCLIDSVSFVEGDQNIHSFFYFRPPIDANFNLKVEFRDERIVAKAEGKWGELGDRGNMGQLVEADEELKNWIAELYNGLIIRTNKKIEVSPKDGGSRVEISLKKLEKDWREALQKMNSTPRKIIESVFNIANRMVTGISNWQGSQIEPWDPTEISKGRAVTPSSGALASGSAKATISPLLTGATQSARSGASSGKGSVSLPTRPLSELAPQSESAEGAVLGPNIICPTCGAENKAGSKTCMRCLSPLE